MPGEPGEPGSCDQLCQAVSALAKLHGAAAQFRAASPAQGPMQGPTQGPSPALASRRRQLANAQQTDWQAIASLAASRATQGGGHAAAVPLIESLAERLPLALRQAQQALEAVGNPNLPLQPIMRDARREHFLFSAGRLSGLVDFGAMTVDTPALDLARLLGDWAGNDQTLWQAGVGAYGADRAIERLIRPFDASGVALSAANWLRWIAQGQPPAVDRLAYLRIRFDALAPRS